MKSISTFLTAAFFVMALGSCGRAPKHTGSAYTIDPGIKTKVDPKIKSVSDLLMSSMDVKIFVDDSLVADTYAEGKMLDECMTRSSLDGDTIHISSFAGMFAGFGYQVALFGDTCIVRHFVKSDAEIYKLKKTDPPTFGIAVPCRSYKLTLVSRPTFKKGDVVEGIIELTSGEYYEVANGSERKYKIQLTGYFKTAPLA